MINNNKNLGKILKLRRVAILLTLRELSAKSGVSSSHLGRIEKGERFPSAQLLRKLCQPLGFEENELFMLAGYLSHVSPTAAHSLENYPLYSGLDPYVAAVLSREPVNAQRTTVAILGVLKSIAKSIAQDDSRSGIRGSADTNRSSGNLG